MIGILGTYSLTAAVLAASGGLLAAIAAVRLEEPRLLNVARSCISGIAALMYVASAGLLAAFLDNQFQFSYVTGYSEKALPLGYKIAAFLSFLVSFFELFTGFSVVLCFL